LDGLLFGWPASTYLQELLDNPNPDSPAQVDPYMLFIQDREKYIERIKEEVRKNLI
jgi:ubiquitin-protein ligase